MTQANTQADRDAARDWLNANTEAEKLDNLSDEEWETLVVQTAQDIANRRAYYKAPCNHESVTTPDGNGAYCRHCGETLA